MTQVDERRAGIKAVIEAHGGKRYCLSCQRYAPAAEFVRYKTPHGSILRCAKCAAKRRHK